MIGIRFSSDIELFIENQMSSYSNHITTRQEGSILKIRKKNNSFFLEKNSHVVYRKEIDHCFLYFLYYVDTQYAKNI